MRAFKITQQKIGTLLNFWVCHMNNILVTTNFMELQIECVLDGVVKHESCNTMYVFSYCFLKYEPKQENPP